MHAYVHTQQTQRSSKVPWPHVAKHWSTPTPAQHFRRLLYYTQYMVLFSPPCRSTQVRTNDPVTIGYLRSHLHPNAHVPWPFPPPLQVSLVQTWKKKKNLNDLTEYNQMYNCTRNLHYKLSYLWTSVGETFFHTKHSKIKRKKKKKTYG